MKILNIVECAYRATLEEQDETVLWFTHVVANAGADTTMLLRGNAVNYLHKHQRVEALRFGEATLGNPPKIAEDVQAMMQKKSIPFYYVEEDAGERGLERSDLIGGVTPVARSQVAKLVAQFDRVMHW